MPKLNDNRLILGEVRESLIALPPHSIPLIIGSPPYASKGERYGAGRKWPPEAWVEWMYQVTLEALRVSSNAVVWIVNGFVKDGKYNPVCEGLLWELYTSGIVCERPCIWHKNAPPNRKDWFGNDWEFCLCFRPDGSTRYFDWESVATPRKYKTGGKFIQRDKNGQRREGSDYPTNPLTRPRDVFQVDPNDALVTSDLLRVTVGGGHLGSKLAHENEAPFPEGIVEPFIRTLTRPGEVVCDPFCGSGTTMAVAQRLGRKWLGIDNRECQIALSRRRIAKAHRIPF